MAVALQATSSARATKACSDARKLAATSASGTDEADDAATQVVALWPRHARPATPPEWLDLSGRRRHFCRSKIHAPCPSGSLRQTTFCRGARCPSATSSCAGSRAHCPASGRDLAQIAGRAHAWRSRANAHKISMPMRLLDLGSASRQSLFASKSYPEYGTSSVSVSSPHPDIVEPRSCAAFRTTSPIRFASPEGPLRGYQIDSVAFGSDGSDASRLTSRRPASANSLLNNATTPRPIRAALRQLLKLGLTHATRHAIRWAESAAVTAAR